MKKLFKEALLEFDKVKAEEIIKEYRKSTPEVEKVFLLISETLTELGDEWAECEIALSQIYMTSRICEEMIEKQFSGILHSDNQESNIAIATFMDYHILGKKIVHSTLLSCGFSILDFGSVASPAQLVEKTIENNIDILLISTLMYHSALKIKDAKELFIKENIPVKILVGGAPFIFDNELWKTVGADSMGYSATDAISIINQWLRRN